MVKAFPYEIIASLAMVIGLIVLALGLMLLHRTAKAMGDDLTYLMARRSPVLLVVLIIEAGLAATGFILIGKQIPSLAITIFLVLIAWVWLPRLVVSDRRVAACIFRTYKQIRANSPSAEERDVLSKTAQISLGRLGWPTDKIDDSIKRWFRADDSYPAVRDPLDIAALFLLDMKPNRDTAKMYGLLRGVYETETGRQWPGC